MFLVVFGLAGADMSLVLVEYHFNDTAEELSRFCGRLDRHFVYNVWDRTSV